ncbi:MAG: DNA gyrase subunit A [Candidatus Omnitrophota bacterium]|jgi:DNA gyrase subunit A|nr:MAG: DNA gyrase subunit A [Candidatus Omnitrophota bacterium]
MFAQNERIKPINIEDEMKTSYISYAMSVIIQRALPDVRDGLKPVQRRIVYAMRELGLTSRSAYKKAARIVGETMGKYHPHGDAAIYDTLVRMAQDFSYRYPLVDGQGNFGSVDGDNPAAMRYTEARLSAIAETLLTNIEKNTVDFMPNFDGQLDEPVVLPSEIPNLLINGSSGIAVGMATNVPPHNLGEVIDATVAMIDDPDIDTGGLMKYVLGPDFPTGAYICGRAGIAEAYSTGRGRVIMRAVTHKEQLSQGKEAIVVTEIPYMVNKAKLVEEIAALVRLKKIEGISDLRDESDRDGMRIVIELKRGENHEVVLNQLYKHTRMQSTFGIILLALVDNHPRYLTLREMISHFIDHRREVIIRRTQYDLEKAEARAHILEGLRIAVDNIDEVIKLIRASKDRQEAMNGLMTRFELSEIQAKAILEMQLQRLIALEREKLEEEYQQLIKDIDYYRQILSTPEIVMSIMKDELLEIKKRFGDKRRTKIVTDAADLEIEDLIAEENMVVTISHSGYVKRIATSVYRKQLRGGRGITAMGTKEEDFVEQLFIASTHHYLLFFTDRGRVHWLKVYEVPQAGRVSKGKAIVNLLQLERGENVTAMVPVAEFIEGRFLMMATQRGVVKKTDLVAYSNPRKGGINAISLDEGDRLLSVWLTSGNDEIILSTRNGMAIRFSEEDVRPMGRTARGVIGIRLEEDDAVVGMVLCREGAFLLTITECGYGKRTDVNLYRMIHRGGKGVIDIQTNQRNGKVVGILEIFDDDEFMLITKGGVAIRMSVNDVRAISRNTQGVRMIRLEEGDSVAAIGKLPEAKEAKRDQINFSASTDPAAMETDIDQEVEEEDNDDESEDQQV